MVIGGSVAQFPEGFTGVAYTILFFFIYGENDSLSTRNIRQFIGFVPDILMQGSRSLLPGRSW